MIKFEEAKPNPELKEIDPKYLKDGLISIDALLADGWIYKDMPRLRKDHWEYFLKGFGEENVTWIKLTEVSYPNSDRRGKLMLSTQARINLGLYSDSNSVPE